MRITSNAVANVSVTIACALLSAALLRNLVYGSASGHPEPPSTYEIGVTIDDVTELPRSEAPTLILYLSSNCRYCTESLPFYKTMAAAPDDRHYRVRAIGREPAESLKKYLTDAGVTADSVGSIGNRQLKFSATPTIVLVDGTNKVVNAWVGLLRNREAEVVRALDSTTR